jgi:hypothetical protein
MDLAPLLCIARVINRSLLFLIRGLLLASPMIFVVSVIFVISSISHVDFLIVLLLLRAPLTTGHTRLSSSFESLNAHVSDCEQIDHHSGLLHGDLLHSLDVTDSVTESIDDLDALDIRDDVPSVAKILHVVSEALIMLLLDDLQSLDNRWMLVSTLEVPDEYGTQLILGVDRSLR